MFMENGIFFAEFLPYECELRLEKRPLDSYLMKILLAIDGSPQSLYAIQALAYFGPLDEITLVHALQLPDLDHPMITPEMRDQAMQEMENTLRPKGEELLEQTRSKLESFFLSPLTIVAICHIEKPRSGAETLTRHPYLGSNILFFSQHFSLAHLLLDCSIERFFKRVLQAITKESTMNKTQADMLVQHIQAKSRQATSYDIPRLPLGARIDACDSLLGPSEVFLLTDGSVIEVGKTVLHSWGCLAAYDGLNPTCPHCRHDLSLDGLGRKKTTLPDLHGCAVCGWRDPDFRT